MHEHQIGIFGEDAVQRCIDQSIVLETVGTRDDNLWSLRNQRLQIELAFAVEIVAAINRRKGEMATGDEGTCPRYPPLTPSGLIGEGCIRPHGVKGVASFKQGQALSSERFTFNKSDFRAVLLAMRGVLLNPATLQFAFDGAIGAVKDTHKAGEQVGQIRFEPCIDLPIDACIGTAYMAWATTRLSCNRSMRLVLKRTVRVGFLLDPFEGSRCTRGERKSGRVYADGDLL